MPGIERYVTRDLLGLPPSASCREAARLMADKRIGAVAVIEGVKTLGIVTERDLVYGVLAAGELCDASIVTAMRKDLPVITLSTTEAECADLMRVNFTRHLLVAEEGAVVGIISMRDVIRLMLDEKQWLIDELQIYISGR
ncbi:MAG: CBS domain-containing protein [Deltaproteobacteria bacterium]|nr:MAG: CBS domain-containing protein [Deltaproteobacteria bacterium]